MVSWEPHAAVSSWLLRYLTMCEIAGLFHLTFTPTSLHWLAPILNFITHKSNLGFYSSWMQLFLKLTVRKETSPGLRCCQIPGKVPESEANFIYGWSVWLQYHQTHNGPQRYCPGCLRCRNGRASKRVKFLPFNIWNPSSVLTLFPHLQRRRKSGESASTELLQPSFQRQQHKSVRSVFSDLSQSLLK